MMSTTDYRKPLACSLCQRPFDRKQLTKHHCLPREKGGGQEDVELLCPQCHGMVHATYTNATLAALYPKLEQLRAAPELGPFLRWVRKQPPSRRKRNRPRRKKL
jgi:5-methylcytosine-specific restriction endonuclease McrA